MSEGARMVVREELELTFRGLQAVRANYDPGPGWDTLTEAMRLVRVEMRAWHGDEGLDALDAD